jgi:hypothetical protein
VAGKRGDTLLGLMRFIERFTLNRAWSDLSDDEFFWDPVPNAWSVRRREECRTPDAFGTGEWVADFDLRLIRIPRQSNDVEPLTTIAWLLWHIGSMPGRAVDLDFLGGTMSVESGWTSPYLADHPVFNSSTGAIEVLRDGWRALEHAVRASTDVGLEQVTRFWGYPGNPGPEAQGHQVIASILNEISHHGSQICTLRDLYGTFGGRALE